MAFYKVFLLSPLQKLYKRLREFEEIQIPNKAVEVTVNNEEENSLRLLSGFRLGIWHPVSLYTVSTLILQCKSDTENARR
jgi:hypothetical protein